MDWRSIIRSPDPSRALYLALKANPTASRYADIAQGAFEGGMEGLGNLGHVASMPARAIAAVGQNLAGTAPPMNVGEAAVYGRDMSTGQAPLQYGELLAGTLEDAGELQPGGVASKLVKLAGNAVADPAMAPALLTGAEAVGALSGAPEMAARVPQPPPLPRGSAVPKRMPPGAVPPVQTPPTPPPLPPGSRPPTVMPLNARPPRFSTAGAGWRQPLSPAETEALRRARELGPRG